jgi:outer membrane receptor protein involved in Fe transport
MRLDMIFSQGCGISYAHVYTKTWESHIVVRRRLVAHPAGEPAGRSRSRRRLDAQEQLFPQLLYPVPSDEDGYDLFNAQIAFQTDDARWRIAAAVRNIGDEDYSTGQFFIPGLGFNSVYFNPPRNWSLTARYTFN